MAMQNFQSIFDHLEELRVRLIRSLLVYIFACCVAYIFSNLVLNFLIAPVGKLYFTSPADAFLAKMILVLFGGFFLGLPFFLVEIWQFVSLGLKDNEKKFVAIFLPLSIAAFFLGALFAYTIIVPMTFRFFMSFTSDNLVPLITVKEYISFVGNLMLAFGVVFQLPLVLMFLTQIGIATPEFLSQKRRYAIAIILIVSMIVTPPDVVSLILMSGPLVVLYEIGIVISRMVFARQEELKRSEHL